MDDLPRLGGVAAVTDRRQVAAQELAAAMDMRQREFGTVGGGIAASANVSGVMKQRDQHAEHTAMRAESLRSRHAALMSVDQARHRQRSEEHTSELQSLMRISYAVFCLKKTQSSKTTPNHRPDYNTETLHT